MRNFIQKLKELFGSGQTTASPSVEEKTSELCETIHQDNQYESNVRFIPVEKEDPVSQETERARLWTKEKCRGVAEKCKNRTDLFKKHQYVYVICLRRGYLDEFFGECTGRGGKKRVQWTKEKSRDVADTCVTKSEFARKCPGAYYYCLKRGYLDEFFGVGNRKSKMQCEKIAHRYRKSTQLRTNNKKVYRTCLMNGWLGEFYPGEVSRPVKEGSRRQQILDYFENLGTPVTRHCIRQKMLEISGQPLNRMEYGVSLVDNVSLGQTVFAPTMQDPRYLKCVKGTGKKALYQVCVIQNV